MCERLFLYSLCYLNIPISAITCPALTLIANGVPVDYGSDSPDGNDTLPFGAMGTYECTTGFASQGSAIVTRTCSTDTASDIGGSFDRVEAVCVCKYIRYIYMKLAILFLYTF